MKGLAVCVSLRVAHCLGEQGGKQDGGRDGQGGVPWPRFLWLFCEKLTFECCMSLADTFIGSGTHSLSRAWSLSHCSEGEGDRESGKEKTKNINKQADCVLFLCRCLSRGRGAMVTNDVWLQMSLRNSPPFKMVFRWSGPHSTARHALLFVSLCLCSVLSFFLIGLVYIFPHDVVRTGREVSVGGHPCRFPGTGQLRIPLSATCT